MLDLRHIGKRLLTLRKQTNLSQAKLGDMLYVSHQAISRWERGETLPSIDTLIKLSQLYEKRLDWLLCLNEPLKDDNIDALLSHHDTQVVIDKVIKGELKIALHALFPYLTQAERYQLIMRLLNERVNLDLNALKTVLNVSERRMIIHHHIDHGFPSSLKALESSLTQIEKKILYEE